MDYNSLDTELFINKVLSDSGLCPCLMVGKEYVNAFKRIYKGNIETIYSLDSVRRFLEMYSNLAEISSDYLVLEGLGNLSDVGQNSLLKFIEESTIPIILLTYNDRISPIIMSRCKVIVKRWSNVESLDFMKVKDALSVVKDKKQNDRDFKEYDEIQFYADNCPAAYGLNLMSDNRYDFTNDRIKNIIVSL